MCVLRVLCVRVILFVVVVCVCVCTFVCLGWVREGPRTRICDTFKKIKQERTIGNRQREG
jgi:hypothetical protein